jgi:hypothetical protein
MFEVFRDNPFRTVQRARSSSRFHAVTSCKTGLWLTCSFIIRQAEEFTEHDTL